MFQPPMHHQMAAAAQQLVMQPQMHAPAAPQQQQVPHMTGSPGKRPTSAYGFFVKMCYEEHKKKYPHENVQVTEISKKCSEKWRTMSDQEKRRFYELSQKDNERYQAELAIYGGAKRKRRQKDPNAPKRALSAFFFFSQEKRSEITGMHPDWRVGQVAQELGRRWKDMTADDKHPFEEMALRDRERYDHEMEDFKAGRPVASRVAAQQAAAQQQQQAHLNAVQQAHAVAMQAAQHQQVPMTSAAAMLAGQAPVSQPMVMPGQLHQAQQDMAQLQHQQQNMITQMQMAAAAAALQQQASQQPQQLMHGTQSQSPSMALPPVVQQLDASIAQQLLQHQQSQMFQAARPQMQQQQALADVSLQQHMTACDYQAEIKRELQQTKVEDHVFADVKQREGACLLPGGTGVKAEESFEQAAAGVDFGTPNGDAAATDGYASGSAASDTSFGHTSPAAQQPVDVGAEGGN